MSQQHKPIPGLLACVLYSYDPETGDIHNKNTGKRLGWETHAGYLNVTLQCNSERVGNYRSNRLAWAMHTGIDPGAYEVDHGNRDRKDNRIENLTPMTRRENTLKRSISSNTPGVSRTTDCETKPWRAHLQVGKDKYIGKRRACPVIAHIDRVELERKYL